MNELTSEANAHQWDEVKDEFDRQLGDAYEKIRTTYTAPVRQDVIFGAIDGYEGGSRTSLEVAASLWTANEADKDKSLKRYDNPTDSELQQILKDSENYEGDWYHSIVTLVKTEARRWTELEQAVIDLPDAKGICLYYEYDIEDSEELLAALLDGRTSRSTDK